MQVLTTITLELFNRHLVLKVVIEYTQYKAIPLQLIITNIMFLQVELVS